MGAFPNPIVVAEDGGGPTDGYVPTWDAATETFILAPSGGGSAPIDIGYLTQYVLGPASVVVAQAQVTAPPQQGPAGMSAHVPSAATGGGLVTLGAAEVVEAFCDPSQVASGLWDGIDAYGQVIMVSLDGTNAIVVSLDLVVNNGPGDAVQFNLQQVAVAGSDLSVVGNAIQSAGGGTYTVTLQALAEWDLMTAGSFDLEVDAASGYPVTFTYCYPVPGHPNEPGMPIDVTGYAAAMSVRSSYGDGLALTVDSDVLGGIAVGTTDGQFVVTLTGARTSILPSTGVYDILITPPGDAQPIRLVGGAITTSPAVTRPGA